MAENQYVNYTKGFYFSRQKWIAHWYQFVKIKKTIIKQISDSPVTFDINQDLNETGTESKTHKS